jgi:hypothetical protein
LGHERVAAYIDARIAAPVDGKRWSRLGLRSNHWPGTTVDLEKATPVLFSTRLKDCRAELEVALEKSKAESPANSVISLDSFSNGNCALAVVPITEIITLKRKSPYNVASPAMRYHIGLYSGDRDAKHVSPGFESLNCRHDLRLHRWSVEWNPKSRPLSWEFP